MVIVYGSMVVVLASLVYLGFQVFQTFKGVKPSLNSMNETAVRLQAKMNLLKEETEHLTNTQKRITEDIQFKKEAVQYTIDSVKAAPESAKQVWNAVKGLSVRRASVRVERQV